MVLLLSPCISTAYVYAASSSVIVPLSFYAQGYVGELTFPSPFDAYLIRLNVKYVGSSSIPINYRVDKNLISPGESVSLYLNTSSTLVNLKLYVDLSVYKGTELICSEELEAPLPEFYAPGSYSSLSIPLPKVYLWEFGIPVTLTFFVGMDAISGIAFSLKTGGLQPSTSVVVFEKNKLDASLTFSKLDGVGAKLEIDRFGLVLAGFLSIGVGISELPLYVHYFPPIDLTKFSTYLSIQKELAKLKTPIEISALSSKNSVTIGESITITGKVSPSASGLSMKVLARIIDESWLTATTIMTANGNFAVDWAPQKIGEYEIKVYHEGSEYSTETSSNLIKVSVSKAPSTISCLVSTSKIKLGETITVSGSISPTHAGVSVTLLYKKPDGSTFTRKLTTATDGSFSDNYKPDASGDWAVTASWLGDADSNGATSPTCSFNVVWGGPCIIATATFGSELSPQVQFLRGFRDNIVLSTFAGSQFMNVFNAWYYSFSPTVAGYIASNHIMKEIMKIALYPLIGILHLSVAAYSIFGSNSELGVIFAGFVASSMIGVVYFPPIFGLLFRGLMRHRNLRSGNKFRFAILIMWLSSLALTVLGEIISSVNILMMTATSAFVLSTLILSMLILVEIIKLAKRRLRLFILGRR